MNQWEYNVADFKLSDDVDFVAERLNSGGAEGWDVVAATVLPEREACRVIRKRQKASARKKGKLLA